MLTQTQLSIIDTTGVGAAAAGAPMAVPPICAPDASVFTIDNAFIENQSTFRKYSKLVGILIITSVYVVMM